MSGVGGSANEAGAEFRARVAVLFIVHAMTETPFESLDITASGCDVPTGLIGFEGDAPVDDIEVELQGDWRAYIQAKRTLPVSSRTNSEFAKTIHQLAEQVCSTDFNPYRTRLVVAIGAPTGPLRDLQKALNTLRNPLAARLNEAEGEALRKLERHASALTQEQLSDLKQTTVIQLLDVDTPENSARQAAIAQLANVVEAPEAESAWKALELEARKLAAKRHGQDLDGWFQVLRRSGIPLAASYSSDSSEADVKSFLEQLNTAVRSFVDGKRGVTSCFRRSFNSLTDPKARDPFVAPHLTDRNGALYTMDEALLSPVAKQAPLRATIFAGIGHGKTATTRAVASSLSKMRSPCLLLEVASSSSKSGKLMDEIEQTANQLGVPFPATATAALKAHPFTLVVDGTDELGSGGREDQLTAELCALSTTFPLCSFIVSTRTRSTAAKLAKAGFQQFSLAPFSDAQLTELAEFLGASEDTARRLHEVADSIPLLRRPLFTTMFLALERETAARGTSKFALISHTFEVLLQTWPEERGAKFDGLSLERQQQLLSEWVIATEPTLFGSPQADKDRATFRHAVSSALSRLETSRTQLDCRRLANSWLTWLLEEAQVLREDVLGGLGLPHRAFLEHLEAVALSQRASQLTDGDWSNILLRGARRTVVAEAAQLATFATGRLIADRAMAWACEHGRSNADALVQALDIMHSCDSVNEDLVVEVAECAVDRTSKTLGVFRTGVANAMTRVVLGSSVSGRIVRTRLENLLEADSSVANVEKLGIWLSSIDATKARSRLPLRRGAGRDFARITWPFSGWLRGSEPENFQRARDLSLNRIVSGILASAVQLDQELNLCLIWYGFARCSWIGLATPRPAASFGGCRFLNVSVDDAAYGRVALTPVFCVIHPDSQAPDNPGAIPREDCNWYSGFHSTFLQPQYSAFSSAHGSADAYQHLSNSYLAYSPWTGLHPPAPEHVLLEFARAVSKGEADSAARILAHLAQGLRANQPVGRIGTLGFGGDLPVARNRKLSFSLEDAPPADMDWEWTDVRQARGMQHDLNLANMQQRAETRLLLEFAAAGRGRYGPLRGQLRLENRWVQSNLQFISQALLAAGCTELVQLRTVLALGLFAYQTTWSWPWGDAWERATVADVSDPLIGSLQQIVRELSSTVGDPGKPTRRRRRAQRRVTLEASLFAVPADGTVPSGEVRLLYGR